MVGVSDKPFREICEQNGAGLTIAEMLTSNSELWDNKKNKFKRVKPNLSGPNVVQIAGSDPIMMAQAAKMNDESKEAPSNECDYLVVGAGAAGMAAHGHRVAICHGRADYVCQPQAAWRLAQALEEDAAVARHIEERLL